MGKYRLASSFQTTFTQTLNSVEQARRANGMPRDSRHIFLQWHQNKAWIPNKTAPPTIPYNAML